MKKSWPPYLRKFFAILVAMAAFLFVQNEARAAVAYGAAGAAATGTTALNVPHPTGIAAGNLLVLVIGNKFSPANPPATPAGWTLFGQVAGGLGNTTTNDQGPVFSTIFVKEAVGGESGNLAVTLTGANSSMGRMFRYTKAAGTSWNYAATSGSDNTAGTAWSVTGAANPGITTGDMLIVGSAANTDAYTFSAESVSATGATLGTHTERQDSGTGNGRDMRLVASDHSVTGGTATAAPLFTMTASGSGTNSPTGASVILRIREVPAPAATTTLATGTDPGAATIAPGAAATDVNQFTLQTSSGTEAITSVTVNLSTNSGVGRLAITDNAGVEFGFTASPVAGANTITVAGMSATTTLTTFKVRVTPLSHAAMPLPNGAAYAITAPVTAWAGPNTHAGSDTNPNPLTIDNLSPAGATATSGTAGNANVTLNWTTSASADFNTTGGSVLYRWTATAGAEVPAEGSAPTVNSVNGAATVACVLSSAASAPLTAIDGTGGSAGCNTTALTNGTAYVYKIFQKDTRGNYDTGVTIGTFTPSITTTLATGTDPAAATIAPGAAVTDVNQFTLQTSSGTEAITSVTVNLSTNSGVGRLAITNNAGTELGFTTSPVAGSNTITVAGMSATTTLTTFKVRVTPLSHAAMPLPNGAAYAITAPVTAWAGPNTHAGSDTNPNALTIDNLSPTGATATSGTAGNANVTLNWTTSASPDFNTTGGSVLYRWTATAGAEVPAEGSAPTVNSVNGTATVACVISSAASAPLTAIDGTGGSAGCNTTALAAGTAYVYKIFQKDANGNYNTGVTIGTFTTTYPVPTTTSISPTSKTLGAATFTLTVNGTNFTPGSVVRFNGSNRTTTYVSPTQLTATIPATDLTVVGTFPITVFNPAPGGGTSNAQTFTVNPAPPTATTNAATALTASGAMLNGTVSSNGAITTVTFDYGLTTGYGSSATAAQSPLAAGASGAAVSAAVTGLACNTLYHFRVKGVNSAGTTNGNDLTFTTSACPPQVTVTPASGGGAIPSNTAPGCDAAGTWTTLTGPAIAETVAAQIGLGTIVLSAPAGFEFNTAAPVRILLTGNATASRNINNLPTGTLIVPTVTATTITFTVTEVGTRVNTLTWQSIQVRPTLSTPLAAGNITHTGTSAIAGVTGATNLGTLTEVSSSPVCTAATAPTVTTNAATALTASGATLNGTVSSNGAITTVTFDYGTTIAYGSSATATQSPLAAGASATPVSAAVTGLACNTLYHFRVKGVNSAGTTNGSDGTFTTAACIPTATTNAASGITTPNNGTSWSATLNGIVSSNGAITDVTFEYGLTAAYGVSIAATPGSLAADAVNTAVSAGLIGLNCNTTFHYRVKATSSAGTGNGSDGIFTTGSCPGAPFPATDCAATRFGGNLGCTANDVNITNISLAPTVSQTSCVSGTPVVLDLDMTVNFASPDRWDVGIFIANDGKLPSLLPANGGASSCSVAVLPIVPETGSYTFPDLDGVPQGTADTCGDGNGAINGGTGSGVKRMTGVTIPCYATPDSGGKLFVPFVVSWDNQKSPIGGVCTSNQYPVPNTTSKCNAPLSSVPINVVVMPKINKTHSGASFNSGDTIIYTITVFNDSGGTLQASFFKDPVVAGLAVTGLSCAAANGATCPIANNTVADMQGPTGIPIPSANLPNNSSLIFTVTGTLSGGIGQTISNTATVSIGLNTNSSTDSVTLGAASGSKSFAPDSITEDNNSLMTITFTNPTASAVTGVSFLDTYPAGLVNAASPGGSTTCGGTVTAIAGGNTLTFSGGTIPATGSCTVSVYVTSATANSYINSVSFTPGSIGSASATLMVNAAVYGGFNACDVAAIPNANCTNITTSTTSHITTKIAGSPFTLDLVALKTDGTRQTNYNNKDVLVELLDASNNSGALDAYNCRSTWTMLTPPMTLSPNPTFVSNGLVTVGPFTVTEAYRDVRVRVTNVGGTTKKGCSTDRFAIRPNSLVVIPTDDTWETAGIARPLTNTNVSGGNVHKAGRPFTLIATAMNAASGTTPNYDITVAPAATLSQCNPGTACTASFGIFNLGAGSAASGVVTWSSASYSEVGAFDLTLQDTDFTSVDAADTPWPACSDVIDAYGNAQSRYVCGKASVGRFVPDHFGLTGSVVTRSDLQTTEGQATPFTYMDEPMKLSLVVTAYNKNEGVTNNYAGNFAKLDAITLGTGAYWFNTGCTGSTQCMGLGAVNSATGLSSRLLVVGAGTYASVGDPSSSWIAGVGTFTVHAKLARKATVTDWPDPPNSLLDGPYDTLKFGGMPRDSEGVTLPGPASTDTHKVDLDATTGTTFASNPDGINERKEIFQTAARFGRLWLGNACGSDKRDLTIPFRAEYWNGSVFITNTDDSLTSIAQANIGLGNHRPAGFDGSVNLTHIPAGPFSVVSGLGSFSLLKPTGTPAAGSVDAVFGLGSATATNTSFNFSTAQPPGAGANQPYLRSKWYGATYDRDPVGRAAFGIYCGGGSGKGPVYIRESY